MQPYNFTSAGGYVKTTNTGYTSYGNFGYSRNISLVCSSRKGNFKDPTPFSFTKLNKGHLKGAEGISASTWWHRYDGIYGSQECNPSTTFYASAIDPYNKCLDKLYGKIRRDVDLSIDLYQGRQTVRMIMDFYNSIRHPIDSFTKFNRDFIKSHNLTRNTKLAGNKWLEWQYGIRPTMSTIHELTSELVGALSDSSGIPFVKARASTKAEDTRKLASGAGWHGCGATIKSTDSRRCEIGLYYVIANAERNALSQFTSLNPISFIYENIPYSFVLDWAIDIGGYLRMMETSLMTGLEFRGGYRTDTRRRRADVRQVGSYVEYGTNYWSDKSGFCEETSLNRSLLTSMPTPNLPSLNVKLGAERLLSAASLLSTFLSTPSSKRR